MWWPRNLWVDVLSHSYLPGCRWFGNCWEPFSIASAQSIAGSFNFFLWTAITVNGCFPPWTWMNPLKGEKSITDYILVNVQFFDHCRKVFDWWKRHLHFRSPLFNFAVRWPGSQKNPLNQGSGSFAEGEWKVAGQRHLRLLCEWPQLRASSIRPSPAIRYLIVSVSPDISSHGMFLLGRVKCFAEEKFGKKLIVHDRASRWRSAEL